MTNQIPVPNRMPLVSLPGQPRIAIVGEAPGSDEERLGLPFVGYSGQLLDRFLGNAKILRNACFIGNVYQYRPPGNHIKAIDRNSEQWKTSVATLKAQLLEYKPDLIIALGQIALEVLTGKFGISKWRSSVLPCVLTGEGKVMPTYHPAYVLRQYKHAPILEFDIAKAAKEAAVKGIKSIERRLIINPSFNEVIGNLRAFANMPRIAVDFETLWVKKAKIKKGQPLPSWQGLPTCVGIASSDTYAICIPFGEMWTVDEEAQIIRELAVLMENEKVGKIFHNALFDMGVFIHWLGILPRNVCMDTMLAVKDCYPELPKKLAFATTIFTNQPYYKGMHQESEDEEEEGEGDNEKAVDVMMPKDKLYTYNCLDCCVTFEIAGKLEVELDDLGARKGYEIDMSLIPIALTMWYLGIPIDKEEAFKLWQELEASVAATGKVLEGLFGRVVNTKSNTDMRKLLYDELKYPVQMQKNSKGIMAPTVNANALLKLAQKYRGNDVMLLLKQRQLRTQQAFFFCDRDVNGEMYLDPCIVYKDGRIHAGFNIGGTETGRWSSSPSMLGGRNVLNIPDPEDGPHARKIFCAEPGCVLIGWDKAQADARVVAYKSFACTGDDSFKKVIESGEKIHVWFGKRLVDLGVFNCRYEDIKSGTREYYIAKKSVHSFNYDEGPQTFCNVVLNETDGEVIIEPREAKMIKEGYYEALSSIRKWHFEVQKWIKLGNKRMTTTFGRSRIFFERLGDDLYREAYGFEPQSTVHDDVALSMLRCYKQIPEINLVHYNYDSMLAQCPEGLWKGVVEKMRPLVQQPFVLTGFDGGNPVGLVIPVEFKVGRNWMQMETVK